MGLGTRQSIKKTDICQLSLKKPRKFDYNSFLKNIIKNLPVQWELWLLNRSNSSLNTITTSISLRNFEKS